MTYKGKRAIDLVVAVPLFILSLPLQALGAAAIRVLMGPPVLFRQQRPGLDGSPFTMVKLRTMHEVDSALDRVTDSQRLTRLGSFLRKTSIDELPTLWNVVRGDMSMVGPRPLLMEYLATYTPEQARRHNVKPGLTGLAQVNGRNEQSWEDRFALDLAYVRTQTVRLDLRILVTTVLCVLQRRGISSPGQATMPVYRPNPKGPRT
jgi:lipopolysaccharide/colanic/teichoic acid biosynthesis glycosyltransferase